MTTSSNTLDSRELACEIARIIDEKKGTDIVVLPVGDVVGITEYFVVASASNVRQVGAVTDAVLSDIRVLADRGPLRSEGTREKQWVLIDYGDVIVHIFVDEARRFYEIERLYKDIQSVTWAE
ncbi:MAG: ribosome silencing factor [Ilumatobacteraceae bacterium]